MKPLPIREWLELGQALTDLYPLNPKYFRAEHSREIRLGPTVKITADGKKYGPGRYCLDRTIFQKNNFGRLD